MVGLSWGWVFFHDSLYFLVVSLSVLLEQVIRVSLRRRLGIWVVEQILNTDENLFDGNGGFPAFFLIKDRKTHGAGRIDVGMEQWRNEFACADISRCYTQNLVIFPYILGAS